MKKCLLFAFVCLFLSTAAGIGHADPWADKVVSYTMGGGGVYGIDLDHRKPTNALGAPNYDYVNHDDRFGYTSLGWGGTLVLQFEDNYLTTSGNSDKDLWIYEIGDKIEPTHVSISQNGIDWISVGDTCGDVPYAPFGIDIDAYIATGVLAWQPYSYVMLQDLTPQYAQTDPNRVSYSPWAGADIDAVEACSTRPPVPTPEPGILLMLGTGLVACTGLRKKRG